VPSDNQDLIMTDNSQDLVLSARSGQDLILRSARRARLEGWAQARARCLPFETGASRPPLGEVGLRLSVVDVNRFRHRAQVRGCTFESANRLSHPATTRPRRSAQRVDQGLFALRRGAAKAGHAGRDTIACIAVGDASIAVTSAHVSLIKHAGPPRATPLT